MTCYDWNAQLAHRSDPDLSPARDWDAAREHLGRCSGCRREAMAIDPTLAFRGAAAWSPGADESETVRLAVRALRRTGRLRGETAAADARAGEGLRPRRRVAAAAVFSVVLALLPGVVDRSGLERAEIAAAGAFGVGSAAPRGLRAIGGAVAPAIDGLVRPQARVYEWGAEDLSVVMVVDESLDV